MEDPEYSTTWDPLPDSRICAPYLDVEQLSAKEKDQPNNLLSQNFLAPPPLLTPKCQTIFHFHGPYACIYIRERGPMGGPDLSLVFGPLPISC